MLAACSGTASLWHLPPYVIQNTEDLRSFLGDTDPTVFRAVRRVMKNKFESH